MKSTTAQVVLTLSFLTFAVFFLLLGTPALAAGCIGAIAGQGASAGVARAVNGNGNGHY